MAQKWWGLVIDLHVEWDLGKHFQSFCSGPYTGRVERNLSVQYFSVDRFSRHKDMKRCVIPGELRTLNLFKYWTAKERLTFISNEHEFQQDWNFSCYMSPWLSYLTICGLRMMILPDSKVKDSFILQVHGILHNT